MRQGWPSLWQMTAFLEKRRVWVRFFGRESFANTMPTINACRITPVIDWMHIMNIASGHSSVVCFEPYLGAHTFCHLHATRFFPHRLRPVSERRVFEASPLEENYRLPLTHCSLNFHLVEAILLFIYLLIQSLIRSFV
jgi:hypothetical protein